MIANGRHVGSCVSISSRGLLLLVGATVSVGVQCFQAKAGGLPEHVSVDTRTCRCMRSSVDGECGQYSVTAQICDKSDTVAVLVIIINSTQIY